MFCLIRKKKITSGTEWHDENPVYGIYYFADGEEVDESRAEFTDENVYYG